MKNIICITVLILFLGFAQASWRRFRHHSFRPTGDNLLQTEAQTETKTETEATLTTAVSSETDCDPDCLFKYPYLESDCSDKKETPTGTGQQDQPQKSYPGEVPIQPEENYPVETLQNEEGTSVIVREECYQARQPSQAVSESVTVSSPSQDQGEVENYPGEPFQDEEGESYQWKQPSPAVTESAPVASPSQDQEEAIVPPSQNEQCGSSSEESPSLPPQNQGEVPAPESVGTPFPVPEEDESDEPSSVYRYPFDNAGAGCPTVNENAEEGLVSGAEPEVEDNWEEITSSQPQDIPQYPEDEQITSVVPPIGPQEEPQFNQEEQASTEVEQGYPIEQPPQIVVEDLEGQEIPGDEQSGQIIVSQQECGGQVIESESGAPQGEEMPFEFEGQVVASETVVEDVQGQESAPEIVAENFQGQYVPEEQSEQITGSQQECGGQVIESESGAPQVEEVHVEAQGAVAYDEVVYNPPQPQEQEQVPAQVQPEVVPVYNPYGAGATCSCVCGYGDNTFSYSFKM